MHLRLARAQHESARLELELADPRNAALLGLAEAPALRATQAALGPDECLLHYLVGREGAGLFVVRPETDQEEVAETTGPVTEPS